MDLNILHDETRVMNARIRLGAMANGAAMVQALIDEARSWKPGGYDTQQSRRRDHYEGRGARHIRSRLMQVFPVSGHRVPVLPINWLRMQASVLASVYDYPPTREVLDDAGQPVPADDPRQVALLDVLSSCGLDRVMPEVERRAQICRTVVVAVRWRKRYDAKAKALVGAVTLEPYWPQDVYVVPHHSAPTDPSLACAILVRTVGTSAASTHWEVWRRESVDDEDGQLQSFGPWLVSTSTEDGKEVHAEREYAAALSPFCFLHLDIPEGSPFVSTGDDDIQLVELQGVDQSDSLYLGLMQGHTERVYKGSRAESSDLVGGPDATMRIDTGEELETLDYNPKLVERGEGQRDRLRMWALSRRISQDAVSVEPAAPQSGVARQIANEPQDKARRESEAIFKHFEEQVLLPTIVDVHDTFVDDVSKEVRASSMRFTPATRPSFEDGEARQRRVLEARDAGLISEAHAAVECGWYPTIQAAVSAGLSDELAPKRSIFAPQLPPAADSPADPQTDADGTPPQP